ncbi:MAG: DUF4403 family protein [Flavobacteriales bacterium]
MNKIIFFLSLIGAFLFSCSSVKQIESIRPEPDDASPLVYNNLPSFISLPVSIKLNDIEHQINKTLNGLIYEDNNIEDDDLTVKIWKLAPIQLVNEQVGKIKTILPLKVNVHYRYGFSKFGISMHDTREINLSGTVTLVSNVGLTNWTLNTQTALKSLEWNESPTINIAGKNISITYLINPAIRLFKKDIEKSIDSAIKESMDFKPHVMDALDKISTPTEISSEYKSWLRIVPLELYTTNSHLENNNISLNMGLKCNIETLIGEEPQNRFDKTSIVLKPVSKIPDRINANIVAVSTYKEATNLMMKNFKDQEFGDGKKKVTVKNVSIWHKNQKMVIALDLTGTINGTIYLSGFPQYNETTKELYFDELDYILDTKNKLLKSANWLASSYVLKKIRETCRYSIATNLEEAKQEIQKYTSNYSPMQGVYINGEIGSVDFKKIQLTNKAIVAFLTIDGKIDVAIDGLK